MDIKELQNKARERTVKSQTIEYDIQSIVNRINNGSIKINPDYQRRHRWDNVVSSRLIESLLLNIPIPMIYLSQDVDLDDDNVGSNSIYSVIDGQQRLTAIVNFLKNNLRLENLEILSELNGYTYKELPIFLKRRLDDRSLSCLRIDSTVDEQVKYDIFERLNSGSVQLNAQELRNAIYRGYFNEKIQELANTDVFQKITNMTSNRQQKMEDAELVLRFFSLCDGRYKSYKPNMKIFLNESMKFFSHYSDEEINTLATRFHRVMNKVYELFGELPFAKYPNEPGKKKSNFNTAVYDAVTISVDNILYSNKKFVSSPKETLSSLFSNTEFYSAISTSINDSKKLTERIRIAEDEFSTNK